MEQQAIAFLKHEKANGSNWASLWLDSAVLVGAAF